MYPPSRRGRDVTSMIWSLDSCRILLTTPPALARQCSSHPDESDYSECAEDKVPRLGAIAPLVCTADKVLAVVERSPRCPGLNFSVGVLDDSQAVCRRGWDAANDKRNVPVFLRTRDSRLFVLLGFLQKHLRPVPCVVDYRFVVDERRKLNRGALNQRTVVSVAKVESSHRHSHRWRVGRLDEQCFRRDAPKFGA